MSFLLFIAGLLTPLIGAYFIAQSVDHRLAGRKKWVRIFLSLAALIISFIVIAFLIILVSDSMGMEFTR